MQTQTIPHRCDVTFYSSSLCFFFILPVLPGFMADTFGNYIASFLMAGAVGVIASIIPFLLIFVKRESEQNTDHNLIGEARDQGQSENIDEKDETQSVEDEVSPSSEMITTCRTHQRPASFVLGMEC